MSENQGYSIDDIVDQAARAIQMNEKVRNTSNLPNRIKTPPIFNGNQLADLCKIDRNVLNRRVAKGDLPTGTVAPNSRREFTLKEARAWTQSYGRAHQRKDGEEAVLIAVANSKGGVGKTTTTMCLAQRLSSLSYSVLIVDMDPQGSLSSIANYLPESQVSREQTIFPYCEGVYNFSDDEEAEPIEVTSLDYAIRPTYWDGIDVITSAPAAFGAEFSIPSRALREEGFRFYEVIKKGVINIKRHYDIVLFDCPPTMSYLTIGAAWAADGLIIPVPPRGMDFAATAQFWSLFTTIASTIDDNVEEKKIWKFINILFSMVDSADDKTGYMQSLINDTYGSMVVPVEIPKTNVSSNAAADYKTVYDLTKHQGTAKPAWDRVGDLLEQQIRAAYWNKD